MILAIGHALGAHEALGCPDALPGFLEVVHRLFEDAVLVGHERSIRTGIFRSPDYFALSRERVDWTLPRIGGPRCYRLGHRAPRLAPHREASAHRQQGKKALPCWGSSWRHCQARCPWGSHVARRCLLPVLVSSGRCALRRRALRVLAVVVTGEKFLTWDAVVVGVQPVRVTRISLQHGLSFVLGDEVGTV